MSTASDSGSDEKAPAEQDARRMPAWERAAASAARSSAVSVNDARPSCSAIYTASSHGTVSWTVGPAGPDMEGCAHWHGGAEHAGAAE